MRIVKLDEQSRANILADLLKRDPNNYSAYEGTVQEIVDDVRARGDEALFEYTKKVSTGAELSADNIRVTQAEIQEALSQVDPNLLAVMKKLHEKHPRIPRKTEALQLDSTVNQNGTILGQKVSALSSVGVYVPGGKAAYPSSVLMKHYPG